MRKQYKTILPVFCLRNNRRNWKNFDTALLEVCWLQLSVTLRCTENILGTSNITSNFIEISMNVTQVNFWKIRWWRWKMCSLKDNTNLSFYVLNLLIKVSSLTRLLRLTGTWSKRHIRDDSMLFFTEIHYELQKRAKASKLFFDVERIGCTVEAAWHCRIEPRAIWPDCISKVRLKQEKFESGWHINWNCSHEEARWKQNRHTYAPTCHEAKYNRRIVLDDLSIIYEARIHIIVKIIN